MLQKVSVFDKLSNDTTPRKKSTKKEEIKKFQARVSLLVETD